MTHTRPCKQLQIEAFRSRVTRVARRFALENQTTGLNLNYRIRNCSQNWLRLEHRVKVAMPAEGLGDRCLSGGETLAFRGTKSIAISIRQVTLFLRPYLSKEGCLLSIKALLP